MRIQTPALALEGEAGKAEAVDRVLLLGRQVALDPDEAPLRLQARQHRGVIQLGQHPGELRCRFGGVQDHFRIGVQRGGAQIGGQQLAVTVDDIRALAIAGHGPRRARERRLATPLEHGDVHQTARQHREHDGENGGGHQETIASGFDRGATRLLAVDPGGERRCGRGVQR
jgi:hypothetical protein